MSTQLLAWALAGVGLSIVALTYLVGEVLSPPASELAQKLQLTATGQSAIHEMRSGSWVRDLVKGPDGSTAGFRFINVGEVSPEAGAHDWRIFEFDPSMRLTAITTAQSAQYESDATWRLLNVVEIRIPQLDPTQSTPTPARVTVIKKAEQRWASALTPEIFGVILVQPERMAAYALLQYVRHLRDNHQQSERYEIALWSKVFYPLATLVMMALALPFAYLHSRAGGVSLKIFSGLMIGIMFYALNKLFAFLGIINTWPPIMAAVLPSLVIFLLAIAAVVWIERR